MKTVTTPMFVVQDLESRMLLCAGTSAASAAEPVMATLTAVRVPTRPHFTVAFNVSGTYSLGLINPDAGKNYIFKGSGKPVGFGTMQLTGTVKMPGNIANGKMSGSLVMKNSHGTINISITGPTVSSFGPFPLSLTYHITGGTGSYKTVYGSGTIQSQVPTTANHFMFRF